MSPPNWEPEIRRPFAAGRGTWDVNPSSTTNMNWILHNESGWKLLGIFWCRFFSLGFLLQFEPWEPTIRGITHILGMKTFIFHGFGVQGNSLNECNSWKFWRLRLGKKSHKWVCSNYTPFNWNSIKMSQREFIIFQNPRWKMDLLVYERIAVEILLWVCCSDPICLGICPH